MENPGRSLVEKGNLPPLDVGKASGVTYAHNTPWIESGEETGERKMKRWKVLFVAYALACLITPRAYAASNLGVVIRRLLASPALGRAGRPMRVTATIANQGGSADVSAHVTLPPDVKVLSSSRPLGRLADGEERTLAWTILAKKPLKGAFALRLNLAGVSAATAMLPLHFLPARKAQKLAYIPEPRAVKTSLLIGALNCPLWEADKYSLWDQVLYKHPERVPVLGFYNQRNPEVADWETKWAVEHGISFFTYCWYRTGQGGAVKTAFGGAIHDALFKSRFANRFKFTLMWENQNRGTAGVANEHDLLTHLLPYWLTNYFKNPNYLKVDGKPILFIYRPENLIEDLGGEAQVKSAFDKMRAACRGEGFAGLTILGEYRGLDPDHLAQMKRLGLDYTFAYCWGIPNSPPPDRAVRTQMEYIHKTQALNILPQVVTVSQAWSGWNDEGSVWKLPPADFETLLRQAKAFTSTLPKNELGSRMLLLDNWNEWSEGHYIAPYREYGFGYLDAVRRVFSDAPAAHEDLLPEDIGLGPYDTAFQKHLAREDVLRRDCARVMTKGAPEPGLIGWWAFDEEAKAPIAFDYSGHGLGGVMLAERAPGWDHNALLCKGGCAQVAANPLLSPAHGLTIECRVKTDVPGQDNKWLVNRVYGGGPDTGYRLGILGGKPCFEVPLTAWSHHLQAEEPLPTGRWVHLAGTFDGQTMKIYVDGEERGVMERPGPMKSNDFALCLGSYDVKHPAFFDGLLDEVKLYDHALTADAVREHSRRHPSARIK